MEARVDGEFRRMVSHKEVYSHPSYSIYTQNDQPIHPDTRSFIYADGLAVVTQYAEFNQIEETPSTALVNLTSYCSQNQLKARYSTCTTKKPNENLTSPGMV